MPKARKYKGHGKKPAGPQILVKDNGPERAARLRSFRVVAKEGLAKSVHGLLRAEGFRFEPEPFSQHCFRLVEEPFPLGSSLAAFFGYVYIQDRSSMLPPLALAPQPGASVLDMCSSPGSKTGLAAQLVGESGFVLANELSRSRLNTLRVNMKTCNLPQVATCSYSGDAIPLPDQSLEAILLDPPCSGWGTVEKNPRVMELWRESKVAPLIMLQRKLLERASRLLAPGGTLVYSTCTTNSAENEEQVAWAEGELGLERVEITPFEGFSWEPRKGSEGTLRVDGEKSGAQGFFIARLKKPADAGSSSASGPGLPETGGEELLEPAAVVDRSRLASPTLDPSLLPEGECAVFAGIVRFVPKAALALVPKGFVWQAFPLGRLQGPGFVANARLRAFMPKSDQALVLEEPGEIRAILSGASRMCDLAGKEAGLWWRDLPLGKISLRNGRVTAFFDSKP